MITYGSLCNVVALALLAHTEGGELYIKWINYLRFKTKLTFASSQIGVIVCFVTSRRW